MRLITRWLMTLAAIGSVPLANGQTVAPAPSPWRQIAETDAAAALRLIEANHPAAAPELGDRAFAARLATARAHLAERLPLVASYGGYAATLSGLAADLADGHIWSGAYVDWAYRPWAGLVPAWRGGRWIIGAQDAEEGEPALVGAEIESCDGTPFGSWAETRIAAFIGDPANGAVLAKRAGGLLVDDGNPFVPRPTACVFRRDGRSVPLTLDWRLIGSAAFERVARQARSSPRAGMGIRSFAGGRWIALETLGDSANAVVQAVAAEASALRAAPMVVVDLRGNGGGNSSYTTAIARILVGPARLAAAATSSPCEGAFWRASPAALATLRGYAESAQRQRREEDAASWNRQADAVAAALAANAAFGPALPACARASQAPPVATARLPASALRGRLVVVTDASCFSSCLIAVDELRRVGALHVGETTDMMSRYWEVREITLPSGMRSFSTLQKVVLGRPAMGPFVPDRAYPGDLADTAALELWVSRMD